MIPLCAWGTVIIHWKSFEFWELIILLSKILMIWLRGEKKNAKKLPLIAINSSLEVRLSVNTYFLVWNRVQKSYEPILKRQPSIRLVYQ